ncbi:hypothetical protein J6X96_08585 [bacterium]|nr:hypothetical protein [bacterium]
MILAAKTIGIAAGALLGAGLLAGGIPLMRSNYDVTGQASFNNVPVLGAEVCLINSNAYTKLAALEKEKFGAADANAEAAYRTLQSEFADKAQKALEKFKKENKPEPEETKEGSDAGKPLTEEEQAEIAKRVKNYKEYALYCRKRAAESPAGRSLYEKGAEFWEAKLETLKEKGRLAFDEASYNYSIEEKQYAGIGDEPVQIVTKVQRITPEELALMNVLEVPPETQKKPKDKKPAVFDASVFIDTNAVAKAAAQVCEQAKESIKTIGAKEDELIVQGQIEKVMTDENGIFSFKNPSIKPGTFGVYIEHNTLTPSGDVLPVRWLVPVDVKSRPFAWNKVTTVTLDEKNMDTEVINSGLTPNAKDIYNRFLTELKAEAAKIK